MKILCYILAAAGLAAGQTTVYLHDSGTGSWITGASNTTPIVIQTVTRKGWSGASTGCAASGRGGSWSPGVVDITCAR